jgi:hypothetical protein
VVITITLATGTTIYDLVATPTFVHYDPDSSTYEDIVFSVYSECSGGGYFEENELSTNEFVLKYSTESVSNSSEITTTKSCTTDTGSITRYFLKPQAEETITVNCYKENIL